MCLDCPAGTDSAQFLGINISVCDDCGAGTYASATIATSVCIDCVAGKYSTTQGATSASVRIARLELLQSNLEFRFVWTVWPESTPLLTLHI